MSALLATERQRREIELSKLKGELIPLALFEATMGNMIVTARQQLLQLPGRVATQLEGGSRAVIRHKLMLAIHEALAVLSPR